MSTFYAKKIPVLIGNLANLSIIRNLSTLNKSRTLSRFKKSLVKLYFPNSLDSIKVSDLHEKKKKAHTTIRITEFNKEYF